MDIDRIWAAPALAVAIGYMLGAIPFGAILTGLAGAGDLRTIGSGNIGATNVLRTGRKGLAAATLLLDLGKGWLAVGLVAQMLPGQADFAAVAVVVGHCYPVWLRFRGGKGVATMMGVLIALSWPCALIYAATWVAMLAALRISSLAGMLAAATAPVSAAAFGRTDIALWTGLMLLVLWKHRANIARLLARTEPRLGRAS